MQFTFTRRRSSYQFPVLRNGQPKCKRKRDCVLSDVMFSRYLWMYLSFHSIEILLETFFPAATCSECRCPCSLYDSMCSSGSIPWYCVEVMGQLHAPAVLPWRKSLQCRLNRGLGDFQSWSGKRCIYYYYYYCCCYGGQKCLLFWRFPGGVRSSFWQRWGGNMVKRGEVKKVACWEVVCWKYGAEEWRLVFGLSFEFGGHCEEILIALWRLRFRETFEVNVEEGCLRNKKCNLVCEQKLRICPRTENNHGKPWPCWLVTPSSDFSQEFLYSYTRTLTEVTLCAFALCVRNNRIFCTEIFLVPLYE